MLPDDAGSSSYVTFKDGSDARCLSNDGMVPTRDAAELLGVGAGDTVHLKTSSLDEASVPLASVARRLSGQRRISDAEVPYQQLSGTMCSRTSFYLLLSGTDDEKEAFADTLAENR